MKIVSEAEILDFAEGLPLDSAAEESLVMMISGSPEFRRDVEEYRRDLARIDLEVAKLPLTLELARQLPELTRAALKKRYDADLAPEKFFRSREIWIVVGFVMAMLGMVAAYVWLWQRN